MATRAGGYASRSALFCLFRIVALVALCWAGVHTEHSRVRKLLLKFHLPYEVEHDVVCFEVVPVLLEENLRAEIQVFAGFIYTECLGALLVVYDHIERVVLLFVDCELNALLVVQTECVYGFFCES